MSVLGPTSRLPSSARGSVVQPQSLHCPPLPHQSPPLDDAERTASPSKTTKNQGVPACPLACVPELTLALEDEASTAALPGHVLKAQETGVHSQALTPLPYSVHVAWAHLGHEGHWRSTKVTRGLPKDPIPCLWEPSDRHSPQLVNSHFIST